MAGLGRDPTTMTRAPLSLAAADLKICLQPTNDTQPTVQSQKARDVGACFIQLELLIIIIFTIIIGC